MSKDVGPDGQAPHYAIGKRGFLSLSDGTFLPYDSAFPGPEYFDSPAFVVVNLPVGEHA